MKNFSKNSLQKRILLGITGSIAAYKSAEIVRLFRKQNIEIKIVMTRSACKFVQPLTFSALSNNYVYIEMFKRKRIFNCEHIELAKWADLILIAPASANIIAKLTFGIADDLLTTICLACKKRIYLAPAMNKTMWEKDVVQNNVIILKDRGMKILEPNQGEQVCGDVGPGCMLEPKAIVNEILNKRDKLLKGKNILITAGPTIEPIDPVRFISNYSSGKMGYAIVNAAIEHEANVILISGPVNLSIPSGCHKYMNIKTAYQMYESVMRYIDRSDIFIATAAVSDFRIKTIVNQKIKHESKNHLKLALIKNLDILSAVAKLDNAPLTIGFAAETENLEENVIKKLQQKGIDAIAGNLVSDDLGFNKDENELMIITKSGKKSVFKKKNKRLLADELIEFIWQNMIC